MGSPYKKHAWRDGSHRPQYGYGVTLSPVGFGEGIQSCFLASIAFDSGRRAAQTPD